MALNEKDIFWNSVDPAEREKLARYVLESIDEIAKICKTKAGKYLTYRIEPPDSCKGKQRIRLAREVLHYGHSECIGWVLLYAACVEHVRIHPLIILTDQHAILGYWVNEDDAKKNSRVVLKTADIKRYLKAQRIKVANATRIPSDEKGKLLEFENAEKEAETHLPYVLSAIDIRTAREAGIEPLLLLLPCPTNHELPPAEFFHERPELQILHDFWREEEMWGVLALLGIGGAGKTALMHRFLEQVVIDDNKNQARG